MEHDDGNVVRNEVDEDDHHYCHNSVKTEWK